MWVKLFKEIVIENQEAEENENSIEDHKKVETKIGKERINGITEKTRQPPRLELTNIKIM